MTATMAGRGCPSQEDAIAAEFLLAYKTLPEKRRNRVDKLIGMLLDSEDEQEDIEITEAILEIVAIGQKRKEQPPKKVTEDLDSGVDPKARESVWGYYRNIGAALKRARELKGWTQLRLSEKAGLPQSHICRLEAGMHAPTRKTIERLAEALDVPPSELDILWDD